MQAGFREMPWAHFPASGIGWPAELDCWLSDLADWDDHDINYLFYVVPPLKCPTSTRRRGNFAPVVGCHRSSLRCGRRISNAWSIAFAVIGLLGARSKWVADWVANRAREGLPGACERWYVLVFCLVIVADPRLPNCAAVHGKEKVYGSIT